MKILYVTDGIAPFVVGGMQAVARRHIECLVGAGFEVVSISSGREPGSEPKGLPWTNIFIPWPDRTFLQRLSPWRYVNDLKAFSEQVVEVIDRIGPDCIYTEGPLLDAYLTRPKERRVPVIFHPHGLEMFQYKGSLPEDAKSWPLRGITARHARLADKVIAQGGRGQIAKILQQRLGVPRERFVVLPNAAPRVSPEEPVRLHHGGRFLFIGRNERRKGLPLLLRAFRQLDSGEATLNVVGFSLKDQSEERSVRFHGVVRDRRRIARHYREADFLVVPSYSEGMPTVILEAFAAGLPVIATDVGAVAELVREGETGFLIEPGNEKALLHAMNKALSLPNAAYAQMSRNALELARGPFSAKTICEQLTMLIFQCERIAIHE